MRGRLIRKKLQSPITKPPLFPLSPHCLFSHPQKCSGGIIDKQPTSSKNNFILCMWRCQWSYIHFKYDNKISRLSEPIYQCTIRPTNLTNHFKSNPGNALCLYMNNPHIQMPPHDPVRPQTSPISITLCLT